MWTNLVGNLGSNLYAYFVLLYQIQWFQKYLGTCYDFDFGFFHLSVSGDYTVQLGYFCDRSRLDCGINLIFFESHAQQTNITNYFILRNCKVTLIFYNLTDLIIVVWQNITGPHQFEVLKALAKFIYFDLVELGDS